MIIMIMVNAESILHVFGYVIAVKQKTSASVLHGFIPMIGLTEHRCFPFNHLAFLYDLHKRSFTIVHVRPGESSQ
jgi:hypothetical protein